jgi:hypothetical protein
MPVDEAAGGARIPSGDARWCAVCVLTYLALCLATGAVWEPAHDEGVTWDQAIGHLDLPRATETPAAVRDLYAVLDGRMTHGPAEVLDALMMRAGMHPPAYYLMMNRLSRIFGTGRLAMAWPSLVLGAVGLLAMRRLAQRMVPESGGLSWSMALFSISPWLIGFSNYARPYVLVLSLALLASVAVLECASPGARLRWRLLFAAVSALGLYTLYHYAFVLAWHGVALTISALRRSQGERVRELAWVVAMGAAVALLFAPWVPRLLLHLELTGSRPFYFAGPLPIEQWGPRALLLLRILALGEMQDLGPFRIAFTLLAMGSAPLAAWSFAPIRFRRLDPQARLLWLTAPVLPAALAAADWAHGTHTIFVSKTCFAFLPLLVLLNVRAWSALPRPVWARAGLLAWALLLGAASIATVGLRAYQETPFERAAAHLARRDYPEHWVVLSSERRGYVSPLLLTMRSAGVEHVRVVVASADELPAFVDRALAPSGARELTLLNLSVFYERSGPWRGEQLAQLVERAMADGWHVASLREAARESASEIGPRRLTLARGLQARYFSN